MKKGLLVVSIVAVVAAVLGLGGYAVAQARGAVVAGFGIDAIEFDHGGNLPPVLAPSKRLPNLAA